MSSTRLDVRLVELGLAPSRERAQSLVRAGQVLVDERVVDKPGTKIADGAALRVRGEDHPYVSRGGVKLAFGLEHFALSVEGCVCADLGASTGGFTDCLLQSGARKVYAIDVGYGQLAWKIRTDPRVVVMERTNVRHLEGLPEPVDFVVADLSFISVTKVIGAMVRIAVAGARGILLVKPQFEVGPDRVSKKGGVVRDAGDREAALKATSDELERHAIRVLGHVESPILGAKSGNRNFSSKSHSPDEPQPTQGTKMAKRLILLAHGAGGGSDHPWMDKWAKLLEPLGRVVRFDYPFARKNKELDAKTKAEAAAKGEDASEDEGAENGHGRRRGQGKRHQPDPLKALIQAHRDAIEDAKKDGDKVVLIGKSMGGRVGCHVSLEDGVAVDGIVCLGYPLQAQGRRVKGTRDEVLRELRSPVMFVQGTRDRMCPIRSLDAIRQDLEVPNYIHVVEGGDHSLIVRKTQLDELGKKQEDLDTAAVDAIKAFLDKHVPV